MNFSRRQSYLCLIIACLILPISGLTVDIYVPSLPAVTHYFQVDKSLAQLTVTFYMIGLGLMQLFAGSISDSFGRKKPFVISMLIYIVVSLLIPLSQNIVELLAFRFIQGVTVATVSVSLRSVVSDLFTGKELYKMMSYVVMSWSIGPIIAPVIGGYLEFYLGWQANFYFLGIYGILTFVAALLFLPETSAYRQPFKFSAIMRTNKEMLFTWEYARGLLINGLLYSTIILFAVVAPFLLQNVLHYTPVQFGHAALFIGLLWFLGGLTNRFLVDVHHHKKSIYCFNVMFFIALIMVLISLFLPMNLYSIMLPICIIMWLGGIVFPNNFAYGMSLFPTKTGTANALLGAFVFLIAGAGSAVATLLRSSTQLPLSLAYLGVVILCLLVLRVRHQATSQKQQTVQQTTLE